jgi:hypothetical protein
MPALDTTVKFFDKDMASAPSLAATAGNLISVLDACLVNGFAQKTADSVVVSAGVATATISTGHSFRAHTVALIAGATPAGLNGQHKVLSVTTNTVRFDAFGVEDGTATGTITLKLAPLGWEKVFTGTNVAVYRSPNVQSTRSYLRVDDSVTTSARVAGYLAMTDANTGTDKFPSDAQFAGGLYISKSSDATQRHWWLFGDDRRFYISIPPTYQGSAYASAYTHGFGDIQSTKPNDPYRFMVGAHSSDCTGSGYDASRGPLNLANSTYGMLRYFARNYTGVGIPVQLNIFFQQGSYPGQGGYTFPNPEDSGVYLTRVWLNENSTVRGWLPGLYSSMQNVVTNVADGDIWTNVIGLEGKTFIYRHCIGGGYFIDVTGPWEN